MTTRIDDLLDRIGVLERELEAELNHARSQWHYRIESGRVRFQREAQLVHRRFKQSIPAFLRDSSLLNIITAPIIYSLIVPIALVDLWITVYQAVCFRAYGIGRIRRAAYIVFDRQHLAYLNSIEKLNCLYCSYANGVLAYVREVAGRTEQYWCPIRHAKRVHAPHTQYRHFVDYGDAEGYHRRLLPLRRELKSDAPVRDH